MEGATELLEHAAARWSREGQARHVKGRQDRILSRGEEPGVYDTGTSRRTATAS